MENRVIKRSLTKIIIICILLLISAIPAFADSADTETLTIKGNGVESELTFTRTELESVSGEISQHKYSVTNNFPTDKVTYRKGVSLEYLLELSGIRSDAKLLRMTSSDGYSRTFTVQELIDDDRYYFTSEGGKTQVPTIIAFSDSAESFDTLSDIELALTMGQRAAGEQNNPWFVKYLKTIEVLTVQPEQWEPVTFVKTPGADGVSVEMKHSSFDSVKIYYTTDGTNPDINSSVYNVSASYYQPELNKPILITEDSEIRAIAIGPGKLNSETAVTAISFKGPVFSDLGNYPWARIAIEELAEKGVINGMGDTRFAPEEPLTRAQFATMIVLALGDKPANEGPAPFNDVSAGDWHFGYVKKAVELGLIHGYTDGSFRPDAKLSREEMLTIIVQAMGVKPDPDEAEKYLTYFVNESRISEWARGYVGYAEHSGLLEHGHIVKETDKGLSFDSKMQASRAEAALTVYRMLRSL